MQSSNINKLAGMLNTMKNPERIGTSIGKVIVADPLTVTIADGKIILTEDEELEVCERLKKKSYSATFEWTASTTEDTTGTMEGSITIDPDIAVDDEILVIPSGDEQTWIAVDRI